MGASVSDSRGAEALATVAYLFPELRPVSIADAAAATGLSLSRIRHLRQWGPLAPADLDGKPAVTAGSLERLLREKNARPQRPRKKRPKPRLQLAWVNPDLE